MNVQDRSILTRTADEFLKWNEGREGRREFVRGRVVEMMVGASKRHGALATDLLFCLLPAVRTHGFVMVSADLGIRTANGIRYPDIVIDSVSGSGRELAADAPLFIAEILSPSSIALDFGEKASEYTAIASLLHYLVLSQDEPRVWLWTRGEDGFGSPEMIAGAHETLALHGLGLTLAMSDLYRGIGAMA